MIMNLIYKVQVPPHPLVPLSPNLEGFCQIPLPPLTSKNFLASQMSMKPEPLQRTDISMKPLGPAYLSISRTKPTRLQQ